MTSEEVLEFEFIMSKRCTNITHRREVMCTVLNMFFKVSRYLETYYRYDDILAVNNGTTQTLLISNLFDWIDRLTNEIKRDLKDKILPASVRYKDSIDLIIHNYGLSR